MLVLQPAPVATCAKLPTRGRLEVWEDALTSRIRLLRESAKKRFPAPSTATPPGTPGLREVVATVVIVAAWYRVPAGVTFRIRWLTESTMKRFPAPSTATPVGKYS